MSDPNADYVRRHESLETPSFYRHRGDAYLAALTAQNDGSGA